MTVLYVREGEEYREAAAQDVLQRAKALIAQRYRSGAPVLSAPTRTREFLRLRHGSLDYEMFAVLFLDLCGAIIYVQCGAVAAVGARYPAVWST
jgi:DNA repair protein RadC